MNTEDSNDSEPLNLGLCGCGSSLEMYEGVQLPNPNFKLVAIADKIENLREKAKIQWKNINCYSTTAEMFRNENLQLVIVATPPHSHHEIISKAARNGIHILVQNPLCRTLQEAWYLIGLVSEKGIGLKVSFVRRYVPAFAAARKLVDELGKGYLLRIIRISDSRSRLL
jgi:predicted dehydrogenase